jgi:DNA modification methylase
MGTYFLPPTMPVRPTPKIPATIKIVSFPIDKLRPAPYNPRTHTDAQKAQLRESIEEYGPVDPIIANSAKGRENIVIGGHFRVEVLREMGFTEVPVLFVDIPSIKREKELNLRLNRNTGEWDFEKLKAFDMDLLLHIGFDDGDLSAIWDGMLETEDDQFNIEKELEQIKKPKTKAGEIYQLGNHRLICGDATDATVVKRLVGKHRIDMVYLDPPYNIGLDYDKGLGNAMRYGGKTKDNKSDQEYGSFLKCAFENALSVAKPDCHFFCYCDHGYIGLLHTLYREIGIEPQRTCLWIKNNLNVTLQVAFSKCYEPCIYGARGKPYLCDSIRNLTEILNKEICSGNRAIDDILDLLDIWLCKRLHNMEYEHPTEKPPTLHEKALRRCTKAGSTVLDLFGGSGSTLIACEQMKRRSFLCEIEPLFCDLIIRRFEALTGLKASLLKS